MRIRHDLPPAGVAVLLGGLLLGATACGQNSEATENEDPTETAVSLPLQPDAVALTIEGLDGPEAVRYDPDRDVYYISNFTGGGSDRDANGFISRATAEGELTDLRFLEGTEEYPLHAPRGMNIVDGVLWVADIDGLHAFDLETATQVEFRDLSSFEPGFLNDIGVDEAGTVYVTDTGVPRVFTFEGGEGIVAVEDSILGPANGITWDEANDRFVFAPWHGVTDLAAWVPGPDGGELSVAGTIDSGYFDGIEPHGNGFLVAAQADSVIYFMEDGSALPWIKVGGAPADIGVDTRRNRIAIPYIALNRVDVFELPNP